MIGFKSLVQQGWHNRHYSKATLETCPYPTNSSSAKDWRKGWILADKGEPWSEPRRRVKRDE